MKTECAKRFNQFEQRIMTMETRMNLAEKTSDEVRDQISGLYDLIRKYNDSNTRQNIGLYVTIIGGLTGVIYVLIQMLGR